MIHRPRLDLAAWHDYMRRNWLARMEYQRHPIISAAVCEVCGHTSSVSICRKCKDLR